MTDSTPATQPTRTARPTWISLDLLQWAVRYRVHHLEHLTQFLEEIGVLDGWKEPTPALLARGWVKRGPDGAWLFRRENVVAWAKAQHPGLPADYVGRAMAREAITAFANPNAPNMFQRMESFQDYVARQWPHAHRDMRVGWLKLDAFFNNLAPLLESEPGFKKASLAEIEAEVAAFGLTRERLHQGYLAWTLPTTPAAVARVRL